MKKIAPFDNQREIKICIVLQNCTNKGKSYKNKHVENKIVGALHVSHEFTHFMLWYKVIKA